MENTEEIMENVVGICATCQNLFMCEGSEEDEEGNVIIEIVCLVLNKEVDTPIAKCSHFVDRYEEPVFFNDPFK